MSKVWFPIGVAFALVLSTHASPLHAQGSEEPDETARAVARDLAKIGGKHFLDGDFDKAVEQLSKAYSLVKLPTIGLYLGRAQEKTGAWVAATETYREVVRLQTPNVSRKTHEKAQADAAEALRALLPKLPKLTIQLEGATASQVVVTLDETALPSAALTTTIPVDPGEHKLSARRGEEVAKQRAIVSVEGEVVTVRFVFEAVAKPDPALPAPMVPLPPPPHDPPLKPKPKPVPDTPWATIGWIGVGVGGAGLLVGAITGGLLVTKNSSLGDSCQDNRCLPSASDDVDTVSTLRPITTVGLVVGGAVLATGIVLLVISGNEEGEGEVGVSIAPTGGSVRVRF